MDVLYNNLKTVKQDISTHFSQFELDFKNECELNGVFNSYQEYLDNCGDFKKPYKIFLRQSDFDVNPVTKKILGKDLGGTLRIVNSGWIELAESITFNFNVTNNYIPTREQEISGVNIPYYNQDFIYPVLQDNGAYDLGFFAGITFECENVVFNLNGHTLKMSDEFYLLQRFFSLIELASSPFIFGQGPADFGSMLNSAKNVVIKNGTLGKSSHHSIHGNSNQWVCLKDLKCEDFEITGIALNNGDNILIDNCDIGNNFKKVPVSSRASPLFFLQRQLNRISSNYPFLKNLNISTDKFINSVKNIYKQTGSVSIPCLKNHEGVSDCLVYGMIINKKGVAVNGFSSCNAEVNSNFSENVFISNVTIHDIVSNPTEVLSISNGNTPFFIGFGAILDLKEISDETGYPKKNTFNNIFFELGKILNKNSDLVKYFSPISFHLSDSIINWYFSNKNINKIITQNNYSIYVNSDIMNHVHKGVMGLRLDSVNNSLVEHVQIKNIVNIGNYGYDLKGDYKPTDPGVNSSSAIYNYGGNICRGIALSSVKHIMFKDVIVDKILSRTGPSYGINFIGCFPEENEVYFKRTCCNQIISQDVKTLKGNRWGEARDIAYTMI